MRASRPRSAPGTVKSGRAFGTKALPFALIRDLCGRGESNSRNVNDFVHLAARTWLTWNMFAKMDIGTRPTDSFLSALTRTPRSGRWVGS